MASSFFFLVFAYYSQSGWAVANLVVAAASMGFVLPFANFILDTTFTLFRRLIRRVTSIELLVVAALVDIDLFQKIRLLDTEFDRLTAELAKAYEGTDPETATKEIDESVKAARRA